MSLPYASKISSPNGFIDAMENTDEIILVVDRKDIRLESEGIVLTKPPLKMYGLTRAFTGRTFTFTYSTIDEIPDDVLTAHIGITGFPIFLERVALIVDQCFFTELALSLCCDWRPRKKVVLDQEKLLNPLYKDLLLRMYYYPCCFSDNPVLLNEQEIDGFRTIWAGYSFETERKDLECLIYGAMLRLANPSADVDFRALERHKKEQKKQKEREESEKCAEELRKSRKQRRKQRIVNFVKWFQPPPCVGRNSPQNTNASSSEG